MRHLCKSWKPKAVTKVKTFITSLQVWGQVDLLQSLRALLENGSQTFWLKWKPPIRFEPLQLGRRQSDGEEEVKWWVVIELEVLDWRWMIIFFLLIVVVGNIHDQMGQPLCFLWILQENFEQFNIKIPRTANLDVTQPLHFRENRLKLLVDWTLSPQLFRDSIQTELFDVWLIWEEAGDFFQFQKTRKRDPLVCFRIPNQLVELLRDAGHVSANKQKSLARLQVEAQGNGKPVRSSWAPTLENFLPRHLQLFTLEYTKWLKDFEASKPTKKFPLEIWERG